eukprot:TRINITY_DN2569_c0_g1_i1.p1 TRINITY_DN2569_c0_g1~~TRINITY_DN2569_c0_g1_i1.p1  ORF type:complete len:726 (+),score=238.44 TRINITY_DN2569_c0_g1_i1:37-2178(+)
MASVRNVALVLAGAASTASASSSAIAAGANPIRRVVTMLQAMQSKVEEEGKKEEKLFDQFMCYCKNGGSSLKASIAEAEAKVPQIQSTIKESSAEKAQLTSEVSQHKKDRDDAKASVAEATSVREKAAQDFAKESADMNSNIESMGKAVTAVEKGTGGAFLQTSAAAAVRSVVASADLSDSDRELVNSFLMTDQSDSEASAEGDAGTIIGILKQMKETMEGDLAEAIKAEDQAKADFESLTTAKAKEIEALQKAIEDKMTRLGEVGVELVNAKEDLEQTEKGLEDDRKFLKDLESDCGTKSSEWEARQKTRSEELIAIADTIKILNDDDALDLFKKTLPSPSLLQVRSTSKMHKQRAAQAQVYLNNAADMGLGDHRVSLLASALHAKSRNFDKVLGMVDDMVTLLGKEQESDAQKKAYCQKELDSAEDEKKALDLAIADLEKFIENTKSAIATVTEEISTLESDIKRLDKEVAESTEQRKEENANFQEELASNSAAKELLALAKNRLQKFYNPKLHKTTPAPEVSEADRISNAFGGAAFMQVSAHSAVRDGADPGPAPDVPTGEYKKKGAESGGVLSMIDLLSADLDKEMQEGKVEEKNAQTSYERFMKDAAEKRSTDAKAIAEKEGQKADHEAMLNKRTQEKKQKTAEALANTKFTIELHKDCDWLLQNFDVRKEARAGEVESLKKAKAVLSGADFSLAQTSLLRGATVRNL